MAISFSDITGVANTAFNLFNTAVGAASPYLGAAAGIRAAGAQEVAGIYRQSMYEVQAIDTLAMAQIRADQEEKIAALQAGRRLQQAEIQSRNYQIQANNLLRNLNRTNAAVRARAAANGVRYDEGSAAGVQLSNIETTMFDVGIADLNSLMARVLGFEDASNLMMAAADTNRMNQFAAERQAAQLRMAGDYARKSSGLLADAQLFDTGLNFAKTVTNPFANLNFSGTPAWAKADMGAGYGYSTSYGE